MTQNQYQLKNTNPIFIKKNFLFSLEQKKLIWLLWNPKALVKFNLIKALDRKTNINYLQFNYLSWKIIKLILKQTKIFGIGIPSFYTIENKKKQKLNIKNWYQLKLLAKKESWFFFGIVLATKWNFLNSSILIWNVFYNEVIEKKFFLFNIRNFISQTLEVTEVSQTFFKKKKIKKKSTLYYIRNYSRSTSKLLLQ